MSDDNNNQIEFWNGEAGLKWVREQEKMDLMLNPLSDVAIDLAQPKLDERVIDIGCGCGATSIELARRGAKVWGMDVVLAAIKMLVTKITIQYYSSSTAQ